MPRELPVTEVMSKPVVSVSSEMTIEEAARVFVERDISGAPVVDSDGKLLGLVEDDDLVIEDARVHFPTYIQIFGGAIPIPGSVKRFEDEIRASAGLTTVGEIMDDKPYMVDASANLEDVATLIKDHHLSRVPVVDGDRVIGIISRHDIVAALARDSD